MAATNTTTTLAGLFKEVYGTSVIDLTKGTARLSSRIKFSEAEAIGNKYHQPVNVKLEHAFAYAAAGSTPTLLTANTGQTQDAQVDGAQIVGRSNVDYEAIAKSMNGDKAAFIQATKHVVKNLSNSGMKRLEIQLLHGRHGLHRAHGGGGPEQPPLLLRRRGAGGDPAHPPNTTVQRKGPDTCPKRTLTQNEEQ